MNLKINSLVVLIKRRLNDIFSDITFYLYCTLIFAINYSFISSFLSSLGSSGVDMSSHTLIVRIVSLLQGIFGNSATTQIFSKGPYCFAFFISEILTVFYITIYSLIKLGNERNTGTTELFLYGPCNIKIYLLASIVKDLLIFIFISVLLLIFYLLTAFSTNIYIDSVLLLHLLFTFFVFLDILSLSILLFSFIKNNFASIFTWLAIATFLALIQMNTVSKKEGFFQYTSHYFSNILGWLNPFAYYLNSVNHFIANEITISVLFLFVSLVYAILLIFISLFYLDKKGI